jgi:2-polyprenyl-3-methyl-5-hydroxy-6-metoxy-1,4-benzoquinol methylase
MSAPHASVHSPRPEAAAAREVVPSDSARFAIPVVPGPVDVVMREISSGEVVGSWRFAGGSVLEVDMLGGPLLTVDGRAGGEVELRGDFIPWPRTALEVQGRALELVTSDREVLRRHYGRVNHQETSYAPRPDPWVERFHRARVAQARRLLSGVRGRVLDIGSGFSLVSMAGPWDFELVACDRDFEAIRHMHAHTTAHAVLGAADEPPFREEGFDAVFAGEIVEHLPRPERAVADWVRLLRPNGRLVLTTPNRRHLLARASGKEEVCNAEHLFEWTRAELVAAVQHAGARVEHVEGLGLPVPVPVPGRGWGELVTGLNRRGWLHPSLAELSLRAGRRLPALALNLAIVAQRD